MPEWCLRFGIVPLVNEPSLNPEQAARYAEQLCEIGLSHGIDRMGVAPASIMLRARTILHERKSLGLHDTMQFTYRNPDRSTDPSASVSGANSIIVGALSYSVDAPDTPEVLSARVARYAWSNYYEELRSALSAVRDKLQDDGWLAEVFVDSNALVDREAAYLAG
ncbi:MAG: tRNA epoxyqueuosine(34) reductase QueG, partial [Actinomycetota bacterium]